MGFWEGKMSKMRAHTGDNADEMCKNKEKLESIKIQCLTTEKMKSERKRYRRGFNHADWNGR